ncbi:hypothetical protein H5V43_21980 (plasmid) [Sphingobium fuliginis]|jgi:hypothetical protein|uniref:Uncharacterized protein n=1 Tax=Sphingobium fuliginis (strain ATCC 27551) TaxID=336203 RepID=A0A7M2GR67_SPHSA|nr:MULTISPECIES: hypothetical protein [Sphingobium]QOT74542.1 hypothetical protein H5V43_21980 [Sphingobium fuliginis]
MSYDLAFRHNQALDPSGCITIASTVHALEAAITDCRNAGKDIEADPAVILLARHFSSVCSDRPAEAELRKACMAQIADIRSRPTLHILCDRGVAYDPPAKRAFHAEGRRALMRLADALGLAPGSFTVRSNQAGPGVSGDVTLRGDEVWVQLSVSLMGPDHEICFRRVQGRDDHIGERNNWASVRELLDPVRLCHRIRRELKLPSSRVPQRLIP